MSHISLAQDFIAKARTVFSSHAADLLSIMDIEIRNSDSDFLASQREAATDLSIMSKSDIIETLKPQRLSSRDALAMSQGLWIPSHIRVLAHVWCFQTTTTAIESLADITRLVAKHIYREGQHRKRGISVGDRVFIGHGHSHVWRELKDFLEDKLGLRVDEFNRVPTAGVSIVSRLKIMLDSATMAFLIMTGEDEQPDGTRRARENVVHEAGLFQGRLGFERSIVLLEEGCDKFSNNAGLGYIRFPKGNIRAVFQDVREVLEREGVITTGAAS